MFQSKTLNQKLAKFISSIPYFDHKSESIEDLLKRNGLSSIKKEINTLIIFLNIFNAIDIQEGKIKSKTEISDYFLRSLSHYIVDEISLITSWHKIGVSEESSLVNVFHWGTRFLEKMEILRIGNQLDKIPLREVNVSLAIIKAKVAGSEEPHFLAQYDTGSKQLQLIGGKMKPEDKNSPVKTLKRKLNDELHISDESLYSCKKLLDEVELFEISPSVGAFSKYVFNFYYLKLKKDLALNQDMNRWISLDELKSGYTKDGIKILNFNILKDNIRNNIYEKLEEAQLSTGNIFQQIKNKTLIQNSSPEEKTYKFIKSLLSKGEGEMVEFKSSIRWDLKRDVINKDLEKMILKSICAFLNSKGGTLIVGVDDNAKVLGLEKDILSLGKKSLDGLFQHLMNLISDYIGVEFAAHLTISFERVEDKYIGVVKVDPSPKPSFIKNNQERSFYVRAGNITKLLNSEEVYKYIQLNW